jgi:hypothetical protein
MPDPAAAVPIDELEKSSRGHPRPGNDPNVGIALGDVPEHFFARDRWDEFVACCGRREKALGQISYPDHPTLILNRDRLAQQPTSEGDKARADERISRLGQSLVEDFRARLTNGEYHLTGFQPPSAERVIVPAELLPALILNFADGVAKGGGYTFIHARIVKSADLARRGSDVSMLVAAWLERRQAQGGEELKKALFAAARHEFGHACTGRAFDAAYRQIYARRRGRPPRARRE